MADDVDFDKLLSDIGNMVDSPRNPKPKTPQKASSVATSAKPSASAAVAVVAHLAPLTSSAPARSSQQNSDIDDILADIGDILGSAPAPSSSASSLPHTAAAAAATRCSRPCVGPVEGPSESRACSKLRCTKCDFAVARFEGFEWKSDVDYLFFRNNHPEAAKLKARLKLNHGRIAYCCQCSWTTAVSSSVAVIARDVRWVCSQH